VVFLYVWYTASGRNDILVADKDNNQTKKENRRTRRKCGIKSCRRTKSSAAKILEESK
jgi:hypothetical protein